MLGAPARVPGRSRPVAARGRGGPGRVRGPLQGGGCLRGCGARGRLLREVTPVHPRARATTYYDYDYDYDYYYYYCYCYCYCYYYYYYYYY
jgi:hypothetical protein